jgi:cytochrome c oxidase cbb3-type subunit 3
MSNARGIDAGEILPATPISDDLTGHNYDGIQEYDNPTPGWWHAIFLLSMVFAVFYTFMMHFSPLTSTQPERLARAQSRALDRQFGELRGMPLDEAKVARSLESDEWVLMGAAIFEERCVLCHDQGGRGKAGLGLNLTDDVYKNVTDVQGILDVLRDGIGVAMPSQRANLNDTEMALVAAYVVSLRGTNDPAGIPPEGVEIPAFFSEE